MPYNGSGVFSVINSFTPATTILSSQVNANNVDFATGLSNVLTRDNQAPMTAPLRLADGSQPLPGLQFANDTNTGLRRSGTDEMRAVTGGLDAMRWDAAQKVWALGALDVAALLTGQAQIVAGHTAAITGPFAEMQAMQSVTLNLGNFLGARYGANTFGATLALAKSRNATKGLHTIVADGDIAAVFVGVGSDGTVFQPAGEMTVVVDGVPGANDMPGALVFRTTPDGSAVTAERMAIRADGRVQIPNRAAPLIQFHPGGFTDFNEIAAPANPAANVARFYPFDDGGVTRLAFRDSAGNVSAWRLATQAEMEAAATLSAYVPPGRQSFHPGHPKAWGRANGDGTLIAGSYNVASVVRTAAGTYRVTLTNPLANADYAVIGATTRVDGDGRTFNWVVVDANEFDALTPDTAGGGSELRDAAFTFSVYGDMP